MLKAHSTRVKPAMAEPCYRIWICVGGNSRAINHPQSPCDPSYARAKTLLQLAQDCEFTTTLILQN